MLLLQWHVTSTNLNLLFDKICSDAKKVYSFIGSIFLQHLTVLASCHTATAKATGEPSSEPFGDFGSAAVLMSD